MLLRYGEIIERRRTEVFALRVHVEQALDVLSGMLHRVLLISATSAAPVAPQRFDTVGMRAALTELGRRRMARTITEDEFRQERALIFRPFSDVPPSQTLPARTLTRARRR